MTAVPDSSAHNIRIDNMSESQRFDQKQKQAVGAAVYASRNLNGSEMTGGAMIAGGPSALDAQV